MALDGMMLHLLKDELADILNKGRVEKVSQPSKDEIILSMRTETGHKKLFISANPSGARINITTEDIPNPPTPPMFCMLLRKHLGGARLISITQPELERVLFLNFEGSNEIGDIVKLTLAVETMGKYSNIILVGSDGNIIDSIKRVNELMSSKRVVMPGREYQVPPPQEKIDITNCDIDKIAEQFSSSEKAFSKCIIEKLQGVCPIVAREMAFISGLEDALAKEVPLSDVKKGLEALKNRNTDKFTIVYREDNSPMDFTYLTVNQYGGLLKTQEFGTISELLDNFYSQRDKMQRNRDKAISLFRLLESSIARIQKKLSLQKQELEDSINRDELREKGDVIMANLYVFKKGEKSVTLLNFYNNEDIEIKLDPKLNPNGNAQKYYNEYKKATKAEMHLRKLIVDGNEELDYLQSVLEALSRVEGESDIKDITAELYEQGYVKRLDKKNRTVQKSKPMTFRSSDGFDIYVGKNNIQNDYLTLKFADGEDLWLHTKNIHGSHVIVVDDGRVVSETAIKEGAMLAALYSKASESAQVPVDYTDVKFVKKPAGSKPGMVIYSTNSTIYTTPDRELARKLRV